MSNLTKVDIFQNALSVFAHWECFQFDFAVGLQRNPDFPIPDFPFSWLVGTHLILLEGENLMARTKYRE